MNEPVRTRRDEADDPGRIWTWVSIAIGVSGFIRFAISDPVLDNLLLDIPLYLAIGLADVVLFFLTFWFASVAVGREKIMRGDRVSRTGWAIAAFAFLVAGGAAGAAVYILSRLS